MIMVTYISKTIGTFPTPQASTFVFHQSFMLTSEITKPVPKQYGVRAILRYDTPGVNLVHVNI